MGTSDLIYDGILCQECQCVIDDDEDGFAGPCGHPRYCRSCGGNPSTNGASKITARIFKNLKCDLCGKALRGKQALKQHKRDKHGQQ